MKLLLVEDFDFQIVQAHVGKGYEVIPLTPIAAWRLDQMGVPYTIPEHYESWCDQNDPAYQRWFRETWLPLLAKVSSIPIQTLLYLLTPLRFWMESFLRRGYQLRAILEKCRPTHIHYLAGMDKEICEIDDDLFRKSGSLFLTLFQTAYRGPVIWIKALPKERVTTGWSRLEWTRRYYDWFRTFRFLPPFFMSKGRLRLCFANVISDKIREVKIWGHSVIMLPEIQLEYKMEEPSKLESQWWRKGGFSVSLPMSVFDEVARFSGLPLTWCMDGLKPQLTYFLESWEPKVNVLRNRYKDYLQSRNFSYIIFNKRNSPHRYAAHMAAMDIGLKTVYVRHGWSADDAWENKYTRLGAFDYYICNTQSGYEFYKRLDEEHGFRCEVI